MQYVTSASRGPSIKIKQKIFAGPSGESDTSGVTLDSALIWDHLPTEGEHRDYF